MAAHLDHAQLPDSEWTIPVIPPSHARSISVSRSGYSQPAFADLSEINAFSTSIETFLFHRYKGRKINKNPVLKSDRVE